MGTVMDSEFLTQNLPTDCYWYLITIEDKPPRLSGETFFNMLKLFQETEQIKFVTFEYADVLGKDTVSFFHENTNIIYTIEFMLELAGNIEHLEWGDFYLFKEYPNDWDNHKGWDYPDIVALTDTTFRAIDDCYMDIYTQSKQLVYAIKSRFEIKSEKLDLLENLDFPE